MSQPPKRRSWIVELDLDEARALHDLAFKGDRFEHEEGYVHWLLRRDISNITVGMCSGYYWPKFNALYVARVAIAKRYRGEGYMQLLLRHMERWASREHSASIAVTYTLLHNYASIGGLLRAGYRFVQPHRAARFVGPHVHYFQKDI